MPRHVELGFVSEPLPDDPPLGEIPVDEWDGGKVGGKPVWLVRSRLPDPGRVRCGHCDRVMPLLLQLSAPIDDDEAIPDDAYYRMLYVFACTSGRCLNRAVGSSDATRSVVVLRCQVAATSPGATAEPAHLCCEVCGHAAPQRCSRCRAAHYCSREHQQLHWRLGHKAACGSSVGGAGGAAAAALASGAIAAGCLLPELDLCTETEPPLAERRALEEARLPAAARQALREHREGGGGAATGPAARASTGKASGLAAAAEAALAAARPEAVPGAETAAAGLPRAAGVEGEGSSAHADGDDDGRGPAEDAAGAEAEGDGDLADVTQRSLAQLTGARLFADRHMRYFTRRVASRPSQCVRYLRWPTPAAARRRAPAPPQRDSSASPAVAKSAVELAGEEKGDGGGEEDEEEEEDLDDAEGEEDGDEGGPDGAPLWLSERFQAAPSPAAPAAPDAAAAAAASAAAADVDPLVPRAAPPCSRCGGPRLFEFQVLPQLIALLPGLPAGDAALDFGVIAVYTCSGSCSLVSKSPGDAGGPYAEEWAWVQPALDEKGEAEVEAARRLLLGGPAARGGGED